MSPNSNSPHLVWSGPRVAFNAGNVGGVGRLFPWDKISAGLAKCLLWALDGSTVGYGWSISWFTKTRRQRPATSPHHGTCLQEKQERHITWSVGHTGGRIGWQGGCGPCDKALLRLTSRYIFGLIVPWSIGFPHQCTAQFHGEFGQTFPFCYLVPYFPVRFTLHSSRSSPECTYFSFYVTDLKLHHLQLVNFL